MRKEILNILKETYYIEEERKRKEIDSIKKKIQENTALLEETIYRVFSSRFLNNEENIKIVLNFENINIIKNIKYKDILETLNKDEILVYKLGDNYMPVYYKSILENLSMEGFNINSDFRKDEIKFIISIGRDYYYNLIRRNLDLK